jgi:hypothetical protein
MPNARGIMAQEFGWFSVEKTEMLFRRTSSKPNSTSQTAIRVTGHGPQTTSLF